MTKEKDVREVLENKGPLDESKLIYEVARYTGRCNMKDLKNILRNGNFFEDDSNRWHLEAEQDCNNKRDS